MGNDSCRYDFELKKVKVNKNLVKITKEITWTSSKPGRSLCWKFGYFLLLLALLINIAVAVVFWCTNIYYDRIYKFLSFQEDGFMFNTWKGSTIARKISVYPFNYTNYEAVKRGTQLPHVEQLGPYVFWERTQKANIVFHDNGTLSFQENRTHEFAPELSSGSLSDYILLPNFPVLAAHNLEDSSVLERGGISFLKMVAMPDDFLRIKVQDFIWGYDDRFAIFSRTLKNVLSKSEQIDKKFGILAARKGLNPDIVTIGTGVPDLDQFALITRFNGRSTIGAWKDEECDKIRGTEGGIFPRTMIVPNSTINIFVKDLCRSLPMTYEKDIMSKDGIPAMRYRMPANVFDSPDKNSKNACYCKDSDCPPCGTFNTAPCNQRLPILISYPHFTYADPDLREKVTGLTPDPEKYQSFSDIHKLGFSVNIETRLQINFFLKKSSNTPWLKFNDGTVLPLGWIELVMGDLTEQLIELLYQVSFTVPMMETGIRYGSLFGIFFCLILRCFMSKCCSH